MGRPRKTQTAAAGDVVVAVASGHTEDPDGNVWAFYKGEAWPAGHAVVLNNPDSFGPLADHVQGVPPVATEPPPEQATAAPGETRDVQHPDDPEAEAD